MADRYEKTARMLAISVWECDQKRAAHIMQNCEPWEHIEQALRESAAQAFEKAADRCETRAKDGLLAKMPTILVRELQLRRIHFLECANKLRKPKP